MERNAFDMNIELRRRIERLRMMLSNPKVILPFMQAKFLGAVSQKQRVRGYLKWLPYMAAFCEEDRIRTKADDISERYREVRVFCLISDRIGEMIPRFLDIMDDLPGYESERIFPLFIAADCKNANNRLLRLMGRRISVIDNDNVFFWGAVLERVRVKINFAHRKYYYARNTSKDINPKWAVSLVSLNDEEEAEGRRKADMMGLSGEFVCISNRDSQYLNVSAPSGNWTYHDYRDSDINSFSLAAHELASKNLTCVRMGRFVQKRAEFENVIDYASNYYDELSDIYLSRHCKFFIGDNSGILEIPALMGTVTARTNVVPVFSGGMSCEVNSAGDFFIPKLYRDTKSDHILSFQEMMNLELSSIGTLDFFRTKKYGEHGIELIPNTPEDIRDLALEVNDRIDGVWHDTDEDIMNFNRYTQLMNEHIAKSGLPYYCFYKARPGAMFLRKHKYLLS